MFYLSCLIGELLLFDLEQGPRCWLFSSHFDYSCPGGWLNRHRCWIPANQRPPLYFQGSTRLWLCITRLLPNIATKRITNGGWWTWQHFYGKYDVSVNVNDLVSGWWVWITSIVFQLCTCTGWWFGSCFIFHMLGIILPTDELIFFRGVGIPPTSVFCSSLGWGSPTDPCSTVETAVDPPMGHKNLCSYGRYQGEQRLVPSGQHAKNYGKSPCLMGKSTINGHVKWEETNSRCACRVLILFSTQKIHCRLFVFLFRQFAPSPKCAPNVLQWSTPNMLSLRRGRFRQAKAW